MNTAIAEALAGWPPPVLDPAGPYAGPVTTLAWALLAMFVIVLGVVVAAVGIALFGSDGLRRRLGGTKTVVIAGVAFPVIVLTGLLVWGLTLTRDLTRPLDGSEMRVRITGEMWWWRVDYLNRAGQVVMTDANELHLPVGRPVALELESSDVIHSFWVPKLSGKQDMIPGRRTLMRIQADRPGVYGAQCAEYCGGPHALMGMTAVAHAPGDFAGWMRARRERQVVALTPEARRGGELFLSTGCGACHRIAGTAADGLAGPDLTYVGSRRTLGAGILANNRGTMMGWIGDSQAIKPGNRMPAYKVLSGPDLAALAAYLEAQK